MLTTFSVTLQVTSYIANPYWPEKAEVVDLQKKSGMNPVRSETKRAEKLMRYLEQVGMTTADYEALVRKSQEPWYRDGQGRIIIPRHQISGCLVQACKGAPSGARVAYEQFRSLIQLSDFTTAKTKSDTLFKRFVLPTDGKGNSISNQRRLTIDDVIQDFEALGSLVCDPDEVKPETVKALLTYAGKYVGVGASRKMGYGRFAVKVFTQEALAA